MQANPRSPAGVQENTDGLAALRAAQALVEHDREQGLAALNAIFRAGTPPTSRLDGRYPGVLLALNIAAGMTQLSEMIAGVWMPWRGKIFDAARSSGVNVFTRDSLPLARLNWPFYRGFSDDGPDTYRAFAFRTWLGPGREDPDRTVLKIDYDLEGNPGWSVRRVLDELVQVDEGVYLGKAHLKWLWGPWQLVAYFLLSREALSKGG
ncbi:MAG TPA: hypothetical protein VER55_16625 [Ardenticatenaceae bacterium]|nr:hypothetical protein [Ardenticatenaceae bacterium]